MKNSLFVITNLLGIVPHILHAMFHTERALFLFICNLEETIRHLAASVPPNSHQGNEEVGVADLALVLVVLLVLAAAAGQVQPLAHLGIR